MVSSFRLVSTLLRWIFTSVIYSFSLSLDRLSCLTNCLLFGFTSEQMVHFLPHLYVQDDNGDAHIVHDKGWIAVFVMFGVERVLILIGILLRKMVPSMSEELSIDIQRRRYLIACEEEAPKKVL